jgi:hypothetical protein
VRVSAVIPNRNGAGLIGRCVDAAIAAGAAEVLVVDDGSSDSSPAEAERAGAVVLPSPGRGFAAAVNAGARRATGDSILVLNSDCFLERDAVTRLTGALADDPGLGVCAASLVETDGSPSKSHTPGLTPWLAIQTIFSLNPFTPRRSARGVEEVDTVPLACAMIRRAAWDEVGGLDERFFFYFEDQDVCRRLHAAGWRVAVAWEATAVHVGGVSSVKRDERGWFLQFVRSRARYLRKHYRVTWLAFAAVWVPAALVQAAVWSARRGPESRRWARTWLRAAWAGVGG